MTRESPDDPWRLPELVRGHVRNVDGNVDRGVGQGETLQGPLDDEPDQQHIDTILNDKK